MPKLAAMSEAMDLVDSMTSAGTQQLTNAETWQTTHAGNVRLVRIRMATSMTRKSCLKTRSTLKASGNIMSGKHNKSCQDKHQTSCQVKHQTSTIMSGQTSNIMNVQNTKMSWDSLDLNLHSCRHSYHQPTMVYLEELQQVAEHLELQRKGCTGLQGLLHGSIGSRFQQRCRVCNK